MMPKNLIYVRHGQSERNLAGKKAFEGDMSLFEEIINRPSSIALLTPEGERQATITGEWLRKQDFNIGRWYTSSYNRAKQTAGLLGLPGAQWFINNNIRERSGGVMEEMTPDERRNYLASLRNKVHLYDLFNFRPDRGESFADVAELRWPRFLGTLDRECGHMDAVIVVNHGDNMWAAQSVHERWTPEDFVENRGGEAAYGKIPNCMVLHYTRINPATGDEVKYLGWVRSCCPWKSEEPTAWRKIVRKRYTSAELLAQAQRSKELSIREAS